MMFHNYSHYIKLHFNASQRDRHQGAVHAKGARNIQAKMKFQSHFFCNRITYYKHDLVFLSSARNTENYILEWHSITNNRHNQ